MIDCGIPFKKMKDELYNVRVLLLTHIHTDHINKRTLNSIQKFFPHIEIFGNHEVYQLNREVNIKPINAGFPFQAAAYEITPFECVHDVLCYGFTWSVKEQEVIYATDTSNMDLAPKGKYDWLFLESNHDEYKLEQAMSHNKNGYNPYLSGKRHLSTQQAKAFYYMNRRSYDSPLVELHMSSRFY